MCVCVCTKQNRTKQYSFVCAIIKIIRFKNCPSQGVHNVICLDISQQQSRVAQINIVLKAININIHFHSFGLNRVRDFRTFLFLLKISFFVCLCCLFGKCFIFKLFFYLLVQKYHFEKWKTPADRQLTHTQNRNSVNFCTVIGCAYVNVNNCCWQLAQLMSEALSVFLLFSFKVTCGFISLLIQPILFASSYYRLLWRFVYLFIYLLSFQLYVAAFSQVVSYMLSTGNYLMLCAFNRVCVCTGIFWKGCDILLYVYQFCSLWRSDIFDVLLI